MCSVILNYNTKPLRYVPTYKTILKWKYIEKKKCSGTNVCVITVSPQHPYILLQLRYTINMLLIEKGVVYSKKGNNNKW